MSTPAEKIAKTESLFRNVNESIAETSSGVFHSDEVHFLCECGDPECMERIEVPCAEYERVREDATHFVVAPGHVTRPLEKVVRHHRSYSVIEKIDRAMARIARLLDPRGP